MPNNVQPLLENINKISRQILSRLNTLQKKSQENTSIVNEPTSFSTISNDELKELVAKRDELIRYLFEQNKPDGLTQELTLLNEMVSLDGKLSSESQAFKKTLAGQVIKLKQGKKVTKSYQKY